MEQHTQWSYAMTLTALSDEEGYFYWKKYLNLTKVISFRYESPMYGERRGWVELANFLATCVELEFLTDYNLVKGKVYHIDHDYKSDDIDGWVSWFLENGDDKDVQTVLRQSVSGWLVSILKDTNEYAA